MLTDDFDYELPDELIAQTPLPRGKARLLDSTRAALQHRKIRDLPEVLRPGDLVIVNDTQVIPARVFGRLKTGHLESGGHIEVLLVEQLSQLEWTCLARPGRRARPGREIVFEDKLEAVVLEPSADGCYRIRFSEPVEPHLAGIGHVPLPPYIKRPDTAEDRDRYQTVFAARPGAIAAPTAGLHFDQELLDALELRGVELGRLTLHVGIGTFKPVTARLVHEHTMEEERYEIGAGCAQRIETARREGRRIVAIGTTVVRTLESALLAGDGAIVPGAGRTRLFITPGFRFSVADLMLTNFHLPRSTLLMLVSAFRGTDEVREIYREAIREAYGFYSYGDAMLVARR